MLNAECSPFLLLVEEDLDQISSAGKLRYQPGRISGAEALADQSTVEGLDSYPLEQQIIQSAVV